MHSIRPRAAILLILLSLAACGHSCLEADSNRPAADCALVVVAGR